MQRGSVPRNDLNPFKQEDAQRARTTVHPEGGVPFSFLKCASPPPRWVGCWAPSRVGVRRVDCSEEKQSVSLASVSDQSCSTEWGLGDREESSL